MTSGSNADRFELADQDGIGCLAWLLTAPVIGGAGCVGEAIVSAGFGNPLQRPLRAMGIIVRPAPASRFVAIAAAHSDLARIFDESDWFAGWAGALMHLPGACRGERMSFGAVYSPAVLVPRDLIVGALS
ncbi:hypothetical protein [Aureimonas sp. SK2]|uniref:hypothetical protein n=1 Tax=Aureimonas sp. SK2 TaxID=3015992 RepID=UPI00244415BF|nr:hypothetical protein [Aureimonas sp. SK2]